MNTEKATQRKKAAQRLFETGFAQNDIAEILHTSPGLISKWATTGDWKAKRAESELADLTMEQNFREILHYQLAVLCARAKAWREQGESVGTPLEMLPTFDLKDIQALRTTFENIKRPALRFADIVRIVREFQEWLSARDLVLAKQLLEQTQSYLEDKSKLI